MSVIEQDSQNMTVRKEQLGTGQPIQDSQGRSQKKRTARRG
jgi:hypothetical protein